MSGPDREGGQFYPPHVAMNDHGGSTTGGRGVSLRDHLAGATLTSLLFNLEPAVGDIPDLPERLADLSYRVADAMLKRRGQP